MSVLIKCTILSPWKVIHHPKKITQWQVSIRQPSWLRLVLTRRFCRDKFDYLSVRIGFDMSKYLTTNFSSLVGACPFDNEVTNKQENKKTDYVLY